MKVFFGMVFLMSAIHVYGNFTSLVLRMQINLKTLMFGKLLDKRSDKSVPTDFLLTLLRLVLLNNVVEFDTKVYLQVWGVSMGSKCSPTFADIFMAGFETSFLDGIPRRLREKVGFYKRRR